MKLLKRKKLILVMVVMITIMAISSVSFTHSGRTDGSGGHKDNDNKSGLGYYHYHHGNGPHLHPNGVCPYSTSSSSSSTTTSKTTTTSTTATTSVSETKYVIVSVPDFDVTVNDHQLDIKHSQYPVLLYNNITYFPMTSDYLSGIGLSLAFSDEEGIKINIKDTVGTFEEKFLGASNILGDEMNAQLVSFDISVNNKSIDNKSEDYPVLMYKNITYFPMTWRFAVTEFGWSTKWSEVDGFAITVEK